MSMGDSPLDSTKGRAVNQHLEQKVKLAER